MAGADQSKIDAALATDGEIAAALRILAAAERAGEGITADAALLVGGAFLTLRVRLNEALRQAREAKTDANMVREELRRSGIAYAERRK